ncbi:MAG: hypothetical protein A2Y12_02030 [Planctomycetes bacterium GWF2_42_9]|nr:MAG: hypothetical protein A2Y12_02030 [Planctomycetes bacterium GWF2_42_9]
MKGCRVCLNGWAESVKVGELDYWHCPNCAAMFLDEAHLPNRQAEYERYLLHKNDPYDLRYRNFLMKLYEPLLEKLRPGMKGLDFGCGSGPALGTMFIEKRYDVAFYDPFFYPDTSVLNRTYDFIICSEVIEHFHRPAHEFCKLDAMLNLGGWLGIMTCFLPNETQFANWHYRSDLTHVAFYCEKTFEYIAWQFGWNYEIKAKDIVLMQRNATSVPLSRRCNCI